jgi:molybdate transport system substrate-binding protein
VTIRVLSAGAAKGLVSDLEGAFTAKSGFGVDGFFNAVGAIKEKFLAGEGCDVLILTDTIIQDLTSQGLLLAGSAAPLGVVRTGIAVREESPDPDISTIAAFKASLKASKGIYVPDTQRSTAGIHFIKVLKEIGIDGDTAPNLRPFPNGETAMRNLADAVEENAIGCTQITEIKYTKGLKLIGPLPKEYELSTVYAAAVSSKSVNPEAALRLVELLAGKASQALRVRSGFELVQ